MPDQLPQFDEQKSSRLMRVLLRVGLAFLAVGVVGAIVYFVLGAIQPVENLALLSLSPTDISLQGGQKFTVEVNLDTAGRVVGAVELHIQYRPDRFYVERTTGGNPKVSPGPVWGNPQVLRAQVNENVGTMTDAKGNSFPLDEVEFVVSRPSPGIASPSGAPTTVALIDFMVQLPFDTLPTFSETANIFFDLNNTKVIIDDISGADILDHSPKQLVLATYNLFAKFASVCPGGTNTCYTNSGQTCDSPISSQDSIAGFVCCLTQCNGPVQLTIIEPSIKEAFTTDTSGTTPQDVAVITWQSQGAVASSTIYYAEGSGVPAITDPCTSTTSGCTTASTLGSNHSITLFGLTQKATYTYIVQNQANGLRARSLTHTFVFDPDSFEQALAITDVGFKQRSQASGVLSWNTTAPANYSLKVYEGNSISSPLVDERSNTCNPTITGACAITHSERLSNLKSNVEYTCEINAAGDQAKLRNGHEATIGMTQCKFKLIGGGIRFDANTILKVDLDRECDSWLSCTSSLSAKDRFEQSLEMCFALGVCDTINPATGECVELKKTVSATNQVRIVRGQPAKSTVDAVHTSSGNAKVGVRWEGFVSRCSGGDRAGQICDEKQPTSCGTGACQPSAEAKVVPGIVPYSNLSQIGGGITVPNSTFEADSVFPWKEYPDAATVSVSSEFGTGAGKLDLGTGGRALQAKRAAGQAPLMGVAVPLGINPFIPNVPYYVTFDIKANRVGGKNPIAGTTPLLQVELVSTGSRTTRLGSQDVPFSTRWQTVVAGPFLANAVPAGDGISLRFLNPGSQNAVESFLLDNVSIKPVLMTGGSTLIPRVCRAYPGQSSPACDYFDPFSGKNFRGWQGYCLMRDPKDLEQCVQWWPTDIISGTASAFSAEEVSGYLNGGRFPLYYCTGARGNYPYIRSGPTCGAFGPTNGDVGSCGISQSSLTSIRESSLVYVKADLQFQSNYSEDRVHSQSTLFLSKGTNWAAWTLTGDEGKCPTNLTTWDQVKGFMRGQCGGVASPGCDAYGLQYVFKDDILQKIEIGICENTGNGSGRLLDFTPTHYLREICDAVTQVVSPEGDNRAYSSRLKSNSKYAVDGVGYTYGNDYLPFGAAVHPSPDNDPEKWQLLAVEPPNTQFSFSEPFQARAGQPYGFFSKNICRITGETCVTNDDCSADKNEECRGDIIAGAYCYAGGQPTGRLCPDPLGIFDPPTCVQGNIGAPCINLTTLAPDDALCGQPVVSGACRSTGGCVKNVCGGTESELGPRTCIYGDQSKIGQPCTLNDECGYGDNGQIGICSGAELGSKATDWSSVNQTLKFGFNSLTQLFAKTYGTWVWDGSKYAQACTENGVAVCTDGTKGANQGSVCTTQSNCCIGGDTIGCTAGCGVNNTGICMFQGTRYGWDETGTQGIPPSVGAIRVNGLPTLICDEEDQSFCFEGNPTSLPNQIEGVGVFPVSLSFTSDVPQDQRGLKSYIVDWGDGEVISEGNLSIEPKSDVKSPHAFGHVYQYHNPAEYFPAGCIPGQTCAGGNRNDTYASHGCAPDSGECRYQIRIQIRDNWDWCNARVVTNGKYGFYGSKCAASNNDAWDYFGSTPARTTVGQDGVEIVVREPT